MNKIGIEKREEVEQTHISWKTESFRTSACSPQSCPEWNKYNHTDYYSNYRQTYRTFNSAQVEQEAI